MLENYKWPTATPKTAADKVGGGMGNTGTWSGFGPANQYEPRTWNDVRRSTEPEFKSKPPTGQGEPFRPDQYYYDEMKNMTDEMYERIFKERQRRQQEAQNRRPFYGGVDWDKPPNPPKDRYGNPERRDDPFMNDIRNRRGYNPHDKRLMKCTKCGKDKMTGFVGNAATFICMDCVWS